jgi:hypothetical protein
MKGGFATMSKTDERLYQIACAFPALKHKGVEQGRIPGITPTDFYDLDLAAWLYEGGGGLLSHGEFLILEALLNLCNPQLHDKFNLGEALQTLDPDNMQALLNGIVRTYNRR